MTLQHRGLSLSFSETAMLDVILSPDLDPFHWGVEQYSIAHQPLPSWILDMLEDFFSGRPMIFDKNCFDFSGITDFQQKVLEVLSQIPRGKVISYGTVAILAGSPGGSQAAGSALRKNPFPLFFPCHRVVNANGDLGGFSGNKEGMVDLKRRFLKFEGVLFTLDNKIQPDSFWKYA